MKKRNKILALLLAMTMCGTALAGCGSDKESSEATGSVGTETTSTETTQTEASETVVNTEPLKNVDIYPLQSDKTFEVVSVSDIFGENGTTIVTEKMEEATGVSIDWTYMTAEQLQLALTGKDLPDAIFLFSGLMDKATMYEYGQGGFFVNFMDYLDIMPNFSAVIEANPEFLDVVQNEDGSVYCLPKINVTSGGSNNLIYYRTDMMKEIGWENPPATTDEFLQYIKDLQKHYGATDPEYIAFNGYQASHMNWDTKRFPNFFFASFGELVQTELTVDSKDNVVLGAATEQYKHYLEFMNEMWNSGAFNTNIYSQEATASQALAAGNHVGIASVHNGHSADCFASGNFDLAIMEPLTSEYWDTQHWYMPAACTWGKVSAISTQCEDIETMVKWFDAWYAPADNPLNEEGTMYSVLPWLGEIGVDHALNDDFTYGELEHEGIELGKFGATQGFSDALYSGFEGGLFPYSTPPTSGFGVKSYGTVNYLWPYAETPVSVTSLTLTQDESDTYNDLWADLSAFIEESTAKFIIGEWAIEEKWDAYVTNMEKMGLNEVLSVYQAAYDRTK